MNSMPDYEVPEPILNSPYDEPAEHWNIEGGTSPERRPGRRPAGYFYRDPKHRRAMRNMPRGERGRNLSSFNLVRERVKVWRSQGYLESRGRHSMCLTIGGAKAASIDCSSHRFGRQKRSQNHLSVKEEYDKRKDDSILGGLAERKKTSMEPWRLEGPDKADWNCNHGLVTDPEKRNATWF